MNVIYYNTIPCQETYKSSGLPCKNNAYYFYKGKYVCGVHSKKNDRTKLPIDPNANEKKQRILDLRMEKVHSEAKHNMDQNKKGQVICSKMRMMKQPEEIEGFLKVFPNFKHGNRKDGFGCPSLSPKDMGPIDHGQPNLPPAKNLENYHQSAKTFPSEVDKDGNPTKKFYETRLKMYQDNEPHRHKEEAKSAGKNKNIPLYSIWVRKDGTEKRCTYLESRQFYCNFYERIAKTLPDFKYLQDRINEGYNIQICGYDAYPITKTIEEHYLDTTKPFG